MLKLLLLSSSSSMMMMMMALLINGCPVAVAAARYQNKSLLITAASQHVRGRNLQQGKDIGLEEPDDTCQEISARVAELLNYNDTWKRYFQTSCLCTGEATTGGYIVNCTDGCENCQPVGFVRKCNRFSYQVVTDAANYLVRQKWCHDLVGSSSSSSTTVGDEMICFESNAETGAIKVTVNGHECVRAFRRLCSESTQSVSSQPEPWGIVANCSNLGYGQNISFNCHDDGAYFDAVDPFSPFKSVHDFWQDHPSYQRGRCVGAPNNATPSGYTGIENDTDNYFPTTWALAWSVGFIVAMIIIFCALRYVICKTKTKEASPSADVQPSSSVIPGEAVALPANLHSINRPDPQQRQLDAPAG